MDTDERTNKQSKQKANFLDRVGDVLTAVQSTVLPNLPNDAQWDIGQLGKKGEVYESCEADNLRDKFSMAEIATDDPTKIEASLTYTLTPESLEPFVRRRLDNPSDKFLDFDHELLGSWLDLENAGMSAFAEQYEEDSKVRSLLSDWPLQEYQQEYGLSLNEKRELVASVLEIEEAVRDFCMQDGNEAYRETYEDCMTNLVDDELQTEIKVSLDFMHGTSKDAILSLAIATGSDEYVKADFVARVTQAQLTSSESIHTELKEELNRSIGEETRSLQDRVDYPQLVEQRREAMDSAGSFAKSYKVLKDFEARIRNLMENTPGFAEKAFVFEMSNHEYMVGSEMRDLNVCENFGMMPDGSVPQYVPGKTGPEYLKDMGYSESVCNAYESAQNLFVMREKAKDILNTNVEVLSWTEDCVTHNLPEIGKSALCVDLEDGRVFRDYEPFGEVTPKSENTVIVSMYDASSPSPVNESDKRRMKWTIEKEAETCLTNALVEREEQKLEREKERKLEQKVEQTQKKGRGR